MHSDEVAEREIVWYIERLREEESVTHILHAWKSKRYYNILVIGLFQLMNQGLSSRKHFIYFVYLKGQCVSIKCKTTRCFDRINCKYLILDISKIIYSVVSINSKSLCSQLYMPVKEQMSLVYNLTLPSRQNNR